MFYFIPGTRVQFKDSNDTLHTLEVTEGSECEDCDIHTMGHDCVANSLDCAGVVFKEVLEPQACPSCGNEAVCQDITSAVQCWCPMCGLRAPRGVAKEDSIRAWNNIRMEG